MLMFFFVQRRKNLPRRGILNVEEQALQVGDAISGFTLVSIEPLEDYHGTGYLFRHDLTGMEVFQVVNDDPELFFAFAFRTPPSSDNGVAHILEHSVLAGSRKYPVRDPFMSLLKGSTNTFMNAMTYPDKTIYPAASPLKKDFDNLFDVYADAVFAPLLREETFWQEGIRVVPDADGNLRFEGVVFNEMLGDGADHDSIVSSYSVRALFPDTPYVHESGGEPTAITGLDYQQFKAFYARNYHPSNCRLFIFGALPVGERLAFLENQYLVQYGRMAACGPSPRGESWNAPRQTSVTSPSEGDDADKASVTVSWATTDSEDPLQLTALSTLVDILLGNPGAPLYKAIVESKLGTDLSPVSGMGSDFRVMPFVAGWKGIDPAKASEAERFLLDTLHGFATEGLPRGEVEAALKRQEFRQQEIAGGIPNGFRAMSRAMRGWMQGLHPAVTIRTEQPLQQLRALVEEGYKSDDPSQGYFERWIEQYLVDNPHRLLLSVIPDAGHTARQKATLDKQLETIHESLDKKSLKVFQERQEQFLAFENKEEDPEAERSVPFLSLDDLPREIRRIEQHQVSCAGQPVWLQGQFTNGIVYADIACDLDDLDDRQMLLMPLYVRVMQMTGMGDMDYSEVAMRIRSLTGGMYQFVESGTALGGVGKTMLMTRIKALDRDIDEALDLVGQLLRGANVDDVQRIAAAVVDMRTEYSGNVMYSGNSFATLRATCGFNPILTQGEALGGIYQWLMLDAVDVQDSQVLSSLAAELSSLQRLLCGRGRLTMHMTADEVQIPSVEASAAKFLNGFDGSGLLLVPQERTFGALSEPFSDKTQVFRIPSTVSYTALATISAGVGTALQTAQSVLGTILSGNGLWEQVRGKGGAYGVECHVDIMEQVFSCSSYRDPRIAGTYADYRSVIAAAATQGFDGKTITDALISMIGQDLRPVAPQERSILGFRRVLYGIDDQFRAMRRQQMLEVDERALREAAETLVHALDERQSRVILAGVELVERELPSMPLLAVQSIRLPI